MQDMNNDERNVPEKLEQQHNKNSDVLLTRYKVTSVKTNLNFSKKIGRFI